MSSQNIQLPSIDLTIPGYGSPNLGDIDFDGLKAWVKSEMEKEGATEGQPGEEKTQPPPEEKTQSPPEEETVIEKAPKTRAEIDAETAKVLIELEENYGELERTRSLERQEMIKEKVRIDLAEVGEGKDYATEEERREAQDSIDEWLNKDREVGSYLIEMINKTNEELQVGLDATKDEEGDDDEDAEGFLEKAKNFSGTIGTIAAGVGGVAVLWELLFGEDKIPPTADPAKEMEKMAKAMTKIMPDLVKSQERYQPRTTAIEQYQKRQELFGDPAAELFGEFPEMEELYASAKADDPGLTRAEFLMDYARKFPQTEVARSFEKKLSQVGNMGDLSTALTEIGRKDTLDRMDAASRMYLSKDEGGYGFAPEQFRTEGQQQSVDFAKYMMDGGRMAELEESIYGDLAKGGDHDDGYYRGMSERVLGGMAPSLARQSGLLGGGPQRLARQMTGDYEKTKSNRQASAVNFENMLNSKGATASNVINANTLSATDAMGVSSGLGGQVAQTYGTSGRSPGTFMTDPTTAYGANAATNSYMSQLGAFASQRDFATKMNLASGAFGTIEDSLEKLQQRKKDT